MSTSVGKVAPYATARPALAKPRDNDWAVFRYSNWDALLVLLAGVHVALVLNFPYFPIIALGLWWNSNTVAHYFIHRPFFRARILNVVFSMFLSLLLGVPQTLWRERHLGHHARKAWRFRLTMRLATEMFLIAALWGLLLSFDVRFFLLTYLPAYAAGLVLCGIHGHYEHARGTVSHYGRIYNFLFLNDGYHVEHHAHPAEHWTRLPRWVNSEANVSHWPAVLRWLDTPFLERLERLVLRSKMLQRFVLQRHEAAFRRLLPNLPPVSTVAVVGGGLFPRTLLILEGLLPEAKIVVIDRSAANIQKARTMVNGHATFVHETYSPALIEDANLVVFPLSFVGDRESVYRHPPAQAVLVHDWLWRKRGQSAIVSFLLLKRLNLVKS